MSVKDGVRKLKEGEAAGWDHKEKTTAFSTDYLASGELQSAFGLSSRPAETSFTLRTITC